MRAGDAVRVILHAGMHKTGTSALQNSLYAHREVLLNSGILYPVAGLHFDSPQAGYRHLGLQRSLEQQGPQGFAIKQLRQEVANSLCHTVVLSHEGFFAPDTDVAQVREALDGFDTTVLLFLRHPVDYLESKYREWVRLLRYTGEIEQFLSWQWPFLDVLSQASEWEEQFGSDKIVIRSYDSLRSPRDILDQLLVLIPASDVTLEPHPDSNPGPTNEYTLAKLVANRLRLAGRPVEPKVVESMELDYGGNGGRLLSSEAVEEVKLQAGPVFADLLKRYGQDPDLTSRWSARPRDDAFFDSSVRTSVAQKVAAAAEGAAEAARQQAKERAKTRARARRIEQGLRDTKASLEDTKAKVSELQGQLGKAKKRLARSKHTEQVLQNTRNDLENAKTETTKLAGKLETTKRRLAEARHNNRSLEDALTLLQRRLDLLKVWRRRNWPEYAAGLKRKLKRSMHRPR